MTSAAQPTGIMTALAPGRRHKDGQMQFCVDSVESDRIRSLSGTGLLDGVTTNTAVLAQTGRASKTTKAAIPEINCAPISFAEVASREFYSMVWDDGVLASPAPIAGGKIPVTPDGLRACAHFLAKQIEMNFMLCFIAIHALLAAKAGASYFSRFTGRMDHSDLDGAELHRDIRAIDESYGAGSKILAASVHSVKHVTQAAMAGIDAKTSPQRVIRALDAHPFSYTGLDGLLADGSKS